MRKNPKKTHSRNQKDFEQEEKILNQHFGKDFSEDNPLGAMVDWHRQQYLRQDICITEEKLLLKEYKTEESFQNQIKWLINESTEKEKIENLLQDITIKDEPSLQLAFLNLYRTLQDLPITREKLLAQGGQALTYMVYGKLNQPIQRYDGNKCAWHSLSLTSNICLTLHFFVINKEQKKEVHTLLFDTYFLAFDEENNKYYYQENGSLQEFDTHSGLLKAFLMDLSYIDLSSHIPISDNRIDLKEISGLLQKVIEQEKLTLLKKDKYQSLGKVSCQPIIDRVHHLKWQEKSEYPLQILEEQTNFFAKNLQFKQKNLESTFGKKNTFSFDSLFSFIRSKKTSSENSNLSKKEEKEKVNKNNSCSAIFFSPVKENKGNNYDVDLKKKPKTIRLEISLKDYFSNH